MTTVLAALALVGSLRLVHEPPVLVRYETGVPEPDARRLAVALKQALVEACQEYSVPAPDLVEVHLHATTPGYAKASRAPWWRAAQLRDQTLHFQPVPTLAERGILDRVVRHEAAHLALRARTDTRFPRWMEEGEAMRFSGEAGARSAADLLPTLEDVDRDLSRPHSQEEERRAYLSARSFVEWLGPWRELNPGRDFREAYRRFREEFSCRQHDP